MTRTTVSLLLVCMLLPFATVGCPEDSDSSSGLLEALAGTWANNDMTLTIGASLDTFTMKEDERTTTLTTSGGHDAFQRSGTMYISTATANGQIDANEIFETNTGDSFYTFLSGGSAYYTESVVGSPQYYDRELNHRWSLAGTTLTLWQEMAGDLSGNDTQMDILTDDIMEWGYGITGAAAPWTLHLGSLDLTSSNGNTLTSGSPWVYTGFGMATVDFSGSVMVLDYELGSVAGQQERFRYTANATTITARNEIFDMSYALLGNQLTMWNVGPQGMWYSYEIVNNTMTLGYLGDYTSAVGAPSNLVHGSPWTPDGGGDLLTFSSNGTFTDGSDLGYWRADTSFNPDRLYNDDDPDVLTKQ